MEIRGIGPSLERRALVRKDEKRDLGMYGQERGERRHGRERVVVIVTIFSN